MDEISDKLLDELLLFGWLFLRSRTSSSSQVSSCQAHAKLLNEISYKLLDELLFSSELFQAHAELSSEFFDKVLDALLLFGELLLSFRTGSSSQVSSCQAHAELVNELSDELLDEFLLVNLSHELAYELLFSGELLSGSCQVLG